MPAEFTSLDTLCVNTIRTLSMDAVQAANSGHPGAPMGLAPVAYTLWQRYLRFDPADATWPNRDRFVLSNGHASMLIYAVLHLAGVKDADGKKGVTLDEIKKFRQFDSVTPGHPEYHLTAGVETTTGPLGQGCANSVGMAIAAKWKAAYYGKPGYEDLFEHNIYTICGDGCLMEGISAEAASLAAHLKLNNLCWLYDDNNITIDGRTDITFTENVAARFAAYGWNVLQVSDANDMVQLSQAIETFQKTTDKPTFVVVKGVIGFGSPNKANTADAHGAPLGDAEIVLTKKAYGWPEDQKFLVPDGVYQHFAANIGARGAEAHKAWKTKFAEYSAKFPELAKDLAAMETRDLPANWEASVPVFAPDAKGLASRESSGKVLNAVAKTIPWMVGGSADLAKSNNSKLSFEGAGEFQAKSPAGRNVNFGVREHAMGAIINGMALSKLRPYAAGFLIFSDYGRTPIRLASIMDIPLIYIFTHDSIGVGEDGPTHQPIEQISNLRAVPGLIVLRPGDANEVSEAYKVALKEKHHPVVLALSRQALPTLDRTKYGAASGTAQGGYILSEATGGKPQVLLIATGSEVPLALDSQAKLQAEGIPARVVSLPSWELFEKQSKDYRDSVIPPSVTARVCIEMASAFGWERYAGNTGAILAMRSFGASAPLKDLLKHFGFTVENVVKLAKEQLAK
ncbi:MAG: transketolase [Fimbriiglobus sp.]